MEHKKTLIIIAVVFIILIVIVACGYALYKHFVTDRITDKGGMVNPEYTGVSVGYAHYECKGRTKENSFSFVLQKDGNRDIFDCSFYNDKGSLIKIDGQSIDSKYMGILAGKIKIITDDHAQVPNDLTRDEKEKYCLSVVYDDGSKFHSIKRYDEIGSFFMDLADHHKDDSLQGDL